MKNFDLYQGQESVKRGFSWPGFFFGGLWALSHRLFAHALGFFIIVPALGVTAAYLQDSGSAGLPLLLRVGAFGAFVGVGFFGNRWRIASLQKRGYAPVAEVAASGPAAAVASAPELRSRAE